MSVNITTTSRLNFAELKSIDGIEFWDVLDLPEYEPQPGDILYTTQDGDRFDLLAQQYYQDPVLMWVIWWANGIELPDPMTYPNISLIIPDPNYVKTKLFRGSNVTSRV
jgi:hypothetical protein